MANRTVAILSFGNMDRAYGQRLRVNRLDVVTSFIGRGERTLTLANKAGIRDVAWMCRGFPARAVIDPLHDGEYSPLGQFARTRGDRPGFNLS